MGRLSYIVSSDMKKPTLKMKIYDKTPKCKFIDPIINQKAYFNINVLVRILKVSIVQTFLVLAGDVFQCLGEATINAYPKRSL